MSSPLPSPVNFDAWVAKVKPDLRPPVGNKLLFGDQLKVMVVGGPNSRDDFHIEVGEVRSAVFLCRRGTYHTRKLGFFDRRYFTSSSVT